MDLHDRLVIRIGCCGFPVSRSKYYGTFTIVELQNTFYNLPRREWAEKLAREVPENFVITMKAWQVITHPSRSPTWRRMKEKPPGLLENYGWLKPSSENMRAWERTIGIAEALNARAIVLQTPGSMPYNDESIRWVREFFRQIISITPDHIVVGWEPRGQWASENALDTLKDILMENNVTHVVDLFRRKPVHIHRIHYIRLHGIGKGETNYKYRYTDEDLEKLYRMIVEIGYSINYVLFNNVYMYDDGRRFKEYLASRGANVL